MSCEHTANHQTGAPESAELAESAGLGWYAIQTRSRHERTAAHLIGMQGYETLFPTYSLKRQWSDRVAEVHLPLFPGYVFCRFSAQKRLPVLQTRGVLSVVSVGRTPAPLDPWEVESIRRLMNSGLRGDPWRYIASGDRVEIIRGPLQGVTGIVIQVKQTLRIVLSITLLQRSVTVEVNQEWLRPLRTLSGADMLTYRNS